MVVRGQPRPADAASVAVDHDRGSGSIFGGVCLDCWLEDARLVRRLCGRERLLQQLEVEESSMVRFAEPNGVLAGVRAGQLVVFGGSTKRAGDDFFGAVCDA